MKTILIILVVALGALTYKFQADARSAKFLQSIAEDGEKEAEKEAKEFKSNLERADRRIEDLQKELAGTVAQLDNLNRRAAGLPERTVAASSSSAGQAPADTAPAVAPVKHSVAEVDRIYAENLADIKTKRDTLDGNLSKARMIQEDLRSNPPRFTEQTTRTNADLSTSTVGVRMSQADRKEITDEHEAKLTQIASQIVAIEQAQSELTQRERHLNDAYYDAREKAQREAK